MIAKGAEGRNKGGRGSQASLEIRRGPIVAEGVKHRIGHTGVVAVGQE